jgi:hypothetical protein
MTQGVPPEVQTISHSHVRSHGGALNLEQTNGWTKSRKVSTDFQNRRAGAATDGDELLSVLNAMTF